MAKQVDLDGVYMGTAMLHAGLSKAQRGGVGAVLVTPQGVTLTGFNGTPPGMSNDCETEVVTANWDYVAWKPLPAIRELVTKPEVIHAELNCIFKAAREGVSVEGSTIYVTLSPCVPCAAMMVAVGISRVVFQDHYRDPAGLDYLRVSDIKLEQFKGDSEC